MSDVLRVLHIMLAAEIPVVMASYSQNRKMAYSCSWLFAEIWLYFLKKLQQIFQLAFLNFSTAS